MITALIFSGITMFAVIVGVVIGHYLTLRGIAYVQPSTKDMAESLRGGVTIEPDPWGMETRSEADEKATAKNKARLKEAGLDGPGDIDPDEFFGFDKGQVKSGVMEEGDTE